jgi:hypothetical protein
VPSRPCVGLAGPCTGQQRRSRPLGHPLRGSGARSADEAGRSAARGSFGRSVPGPALDVTTRMGPAGRGPLAPRTVRRPAAAPGHRPGPGHSDGRSAPTRRVRRLSRDRRRPMGRVRFARRDRRRARAGVRFAGFHRGEPIGRIRLAERGRPPARRRWDLGLAILDFGLAILDFGSTPGSPGPPGLGRWDSGSVKRNPKSPIQNRKSGSAGTRRRPGPPERPPRRPGIRPPPPPWARGRPRVPARRRRRCPRAGASPGR